MKVSDFLCRRAVTAGQRYYKEISDWTGQIKKGEGTTVGSAGLESCQRKLTLFPLGSGGGDAYKEVQVQLREKVKPGNRLHGQGGARRAGAFGGQHG